MNKGELVKKVANEAGITKTDAQRVIDAYTENITESLKKGQRVTLVGFGTFEVTKRKERRGRNPKTGDRMRIPGRKVPRFKAGKALKEAVN